MKDQRQHRSENPKGQACSTLDAAPARVRDTEDGRRNIGVTIAKLRDWCERTETPWIPVAPPTEGTNG